MRTAIGASSLSSLAISSGSSMRVAPGFSASAVLNALRTTSGTVPASQIVCAHLVIGPNIATESMFWWLSLCRRRVLPWPMMHTSGDRSMLASATPVTRFVAPGPSVPRHTPALPVSLP